MNINIRSIVLIGIALVVAGITAMLARSLVSKPQPQAIGDQQAVAPVQKPKMQVMIATSNMPVGHFIKDGDLSWQSWPDETVNENYIRQDTGAKTGSYNGAVVNSAISAGEPILENRLVKPGNRGFMAAVLPAGKRAISIRITPTTGNAGFIFPGDHVDIMLSHQIKIRNNDRKKAQVSETILHDIRVLAINQRTENATHEPSIGQTATLEVTPKEAEKVALIKNMGELTLSLRSLGNEQKNATLQAAADKPTITWDSDVSQQLSTGSSGANTGKFSVQIFRGGVKKAEKLDFNQLFNKILTSGNKSAETGPEGAE